MKLIQTPYFPSKESFHDESVCILISDYFISIDFTFTYFIVY